MFDDIDLDALEKADEIEDKFGAAEAQLARMRERFSASKNKENLKRLETLEENLADISDDKSILAQEIEKGSDEDDEENLEQDKTETEVEETSTETEVETENEIEPEVKVDASAAWLKEKELKDAEIREQQALIHKMYNDLVELKKQPVEVKEKEVEAPKKPKVSVEDYKSKAAKVVKSIAEAKDDDAIDTLAELLMMREQEEKPAPAMSKEQFKEWQKEHEQEIAAITFEKEKEKFFQSEEGKEVLGDEDFADMYQVKFNRLASSNNNLSHGELFKQAYELTLKGLGKQKTAPAVASKPSPKVSESLKEKAEEIEGTKKQAAKAGTSSSAAKAVEGKKFNQRDAAMEYYKAAFGQDFSRK